MLKVRVAATAAMIGLPSLAFASDLFQIDAAATDGSQIVIEAGSNNVPDLVQNLIDASDQFQQLDGRPFVGSLTYAGDMPRSWHQSAVRQSRQKRSKR